MPHEDPGFADIYGVSTHVVPDSHRAARRNVVVQAAKDMVTMLGRTSKRAEFAEHECMLSEVDLDCRLDLPGMFSTRFQHSIPRRHFSNVGDCEYYGSLKAEEAERLRRFWDRMLGY